MSSIREAILVALEGLATQAVIANGKTADHVYRSRQAALDRGEVPALVVEPEEEQTEFQNTLWVIRKLMVVFTVFIRADVPDTDADPYITALHARLMADPTLGGLAARVIEQGTRWNFENADRNALGAELRYEIKYQTLAADLTKAA
ncbi:MAG TPA: hypothetical protein VL968_05695 [Rhodocyclaceae bacterium]|jgi:hypothetical protein|nr:hypothetical protein [Rhodocyclaceae bacterium]